MDKDYDYFTLLSNRIKILHIPVGGKVVHVQFDILSGSDDELVPNMYETAHFLEHMIGRLTSTRDPRNYIKIAQDLEEKGINWNAFVTPQKTGYYLTGPSKNFDEMLITLLNAVIHFRPDNFLFDQEKLAVKQELQRISNQSWIDVKEIHSQVLYPNHPRSSSIADRIKNLQSLTLEKLLKFRSEYYSTENMLLTIVSPYDISVKEGKEKSKNLIAWLIEWLKPLPRTSRKIALPKLGLIPNSRNRLFLVYVHKKNVTSSRIFSTFKVPYTFF